MRNKALSQPVSLPVVIVVVLMFAAMLYVLFYLTFGRQSRPADTTVTERYVAAPEDPGHATPSGIAAVGVASEVPTGD